MIIKKIEEEDLTNYKLPSMLVATARCTFKCDELNGCKCCQNSPLANEPDINISNEEIVKKYINNNLTQALVIAGLEPIVQFEELLDLIKEFRIYSNDPVIIYTGYIKCEIADKIETIKRLFNNVIIKYGRFILNHKPHYDEILGVKLASDNQYAERIC